MYSVKLTKKAEKQYNSLTQYLEKVNALLLFLETNPYPAKEFDLVKLKGLEHAYRVRIGKLRVQYQVCEVEKVILVYFIGLRDENIY